MAVAKNYRNTSIISKLDFSYNLRDRIGLVNKLIESNSLSNISDTPNQFILNKNDNLSSNVSRCSTLEYMANYILNSPDIPKVRTEEYNYYTLEQMRSKFGKNSSLDEMLQNYFEVSNEQQINILISNKKNYKKDISQKITKKDLVGIIKEYEDLKELFFVKLKKLRHNKENIKLQRRYVQIMKDIKADMLYCKDSFKGTIYFKDTLKDSSKLDFDKFDFTNYKHVKELLSTLYINNLNDIHILNLDLEYYLTKCSLNKFERLVLYLYRYKYMRQESIRSFIGCKQQKVSKAIYRIACKVGTAYIQSIRDRYIILPIIDEINLIFKDYIKI